MRIIIPKSILFSSELDTQTLGCILCNYSGRVNIRMARYRTASEITVSIGLEDKSLHFSSDFRIIEDTRLDLFTCAAFADCDVIDMDDRIGFDRPGICRTKAREIDWVPEIAITFRNYEIPAIYVVGGKFPTWRIDNMQVILQAKVLNQIVFDHNYEMCPNLPQLCDLEKTTWRLASATSVFV